LIDSDVKRNLKKEKSKKDLLNYRPEVNRISDAILAIIDELRQPAHFSIYHDCYTSHNHYFRKVDFHREARRLEKRKFIALTKTEKGWIVRLLKKGRNRAKRLQAEKIELHKPRKWDGKWRLFIFDIPEENKLGRDHLRKKLKDLGLYNIQRSVFAYPYDCRNELEFISEAYGLNKYTTYARVDYIDAGEQLKYHFGL
jgi:hypothetical protein